MEAIKLLYKKELLKLKNKLLLLQAHTIKKNFKKDYQSLLEELVFSKLEVDLKYKLDKLKIEYKMLFVQLELLFKKESLLEEVVLYFMHHEHLKISKVKTLNKILVSKLSRKPLLFHVKQLLTMLDFKELMLYRKFYQALTNLSDLMPVKGNSQT